MNYRAFYDSIVRVILILILGLIIFFIFRLALVFNFSSWNDLENFKFDLLNAFLYTGLKFDTVVLLYMLSIPVLSSFVSAFFSVRFPRIHDFILKLIFWSSFIMLVLAIIALTCNYYYYKFFQANFNLLVFGIIDDDTKAVAISMWKDYPVIRILFVWVAITVLIYFILKKIITKQFQFKLYTNKLIHAIAMIIMLVLTGIGFRGSLGVFPIQKDDSVISPNTFINSITMNGIFSLKDAYSDYKKFSISTDSLVTLSKYGYSNKNEALIDYYRNDNITEPFSGTTKKSDLIEKNPPHVIFCLMESMSNYYFDLNTPTLNLMGELNNEIKNCIVFRNFTSGSNGTIHSLEGLIVNTPISPLSQSSYMNTPLVTSVAKTYLDNGYETNFITGAKLGWRNLGKYVSTQYFNNVEGSANILASVPNATTCEWGVYDEFVFQRVYDIIKNAKKPQFVFILSTTNHTPYQLPEHYVPFPINITDSIQKKLRCDIEIAKKNFTAYQYANNCLGVFLKKIKSNGTANNSIVAVTGDHNTLALFDYDDSNLFMKYSSTLTN